jgi:hypothetical protein
MGLADSTKKKTDDEILYEILSQSPKELECQKDRKN